MEPSEATNLFICLVHGKSCVIVARINVLEIDYVSGVLIDEVLELVKCVFLDVVEVFGVNDAALLQLGK